LKEADFRELAGGFCRKADHKKENLMRCKIILSLMRRCVTICSRLTDVPHKETLYVAKLW